MSELSKVAKSLAWEGRSGQSLEKRLSLLLQSVTAIEICVMT